MNYENKYKEALKVIESLYGVVKYQSSYDALLTSQTLEKAFPELKESEDEKIRKGLINMLSQDYELHKKAIAWLEKQGKEPNVWHVEDEHNLKAALGYIEDEYLRRWFKDIVYAKFERQGEQKPKHFELRAGRWYICHRAFCCRADHLTVKEGEMFMCERDGVVKGFVIKDPEKYFKEVCAPAPIEDEQKPSDNVDPKFKVGDWIVCFVENEGETPIPEKVVDFSGNKVRLIDTYGVSMICPKSIINQYHLWTIQDAKDGDVLTDDECCVIFKKNDGCNIKCYCTSHYMGFRPNFYPSFYIDTLQNKDNFHPVTKEQRDLLFQTIKEVGYEWDSEKKELKKIEQKLAEWGEEDENMLEAILHTLGKIVRYKDFDGVVMSSCENAANWLKSIKERVQPQPKQELGKEDEKKIMWLVRLISTAGYRELDSDKMPCSRSELLDWLKSLKPHWKPSEEQLEALWNVIPHLPNSEKDLDTITELSTLYEELKNLL